MIIALIAGVGLAAAVSSWTGASSWYLKTDQFTVSATATLNGQAISGITVSGTTVTVPSQLVNPTDSIVIIYTITSQANQPITVTASGVPSGGTATWLTGKVTTTSLTNGQSDTLQLTLTSFTADGSSSMAFTATP